MDPQNNFPSNSTTQDKLRSYKLQYKIFATLGVVVLLDTILKSVGIPFVATLILYPLLSLFFSQDLVSTIIGLYLVSWIVLFIPAIVLNRKIKKLEKDGGIKSESKKASKAFKITLAVLLIPFGILFLVGIIANLAS
ncbi:MAG: hypothetical protein WC673_01905 [Candidatus Paceibacterota bacterium]|jgi:hypothetical protein